MSIIAFPRTLPWGLQFDRLLCTFEDWGFCWAPSTYPCRKCTYQYSDRESLRCMMNRPGFSRHFLAYKFRPTRGYHECEAKVASRLGVTSHSLYQWIRRYQVPKAERLVTEDQNAELRRLKAELRRVSEEHDILKKVAVYFPRKDGCSWPSLLISSRARLSAGSWSENG